MSWRLDVKAVPARLPFLLALLVASGGCVPVGLMAVDAARETSAQHQRFAEGAFAPAAEEACRARAARHGRVEITKVEPHGESAMRVYGTIDRFGGSPGRSFACVFRKDGHMPHFRLG
jgi:hypothetical protein